MAGTGRWLGNLYGRGAISGENGGSDPYNKLGVQLQVRVDVRNSISPDIAFYEVRQKGAKNAPGAGQRTKMFCDGPSQSGVCFGQVPPRRGQSMGARALNFPRAGPNVTCSGRLHSIPRTIRKLIDRTARVS